MLTDFLSCQGILSGPKYSFPKPRDYYPVCVESALCRLDMLLVLGTFLSARD